MIAKYNFAPILMDAPEEPKEETTVSISRAANHKYGLANKAVRLVYDESKRAFGMEIVYHKPESESWDKKTMRLLEEQHTGQIKFAVGRIMGKLGLGDTDFKNLVLDKYHGGNLGRDTFFVILPKVKKPKAEDGATKSQGDNNEG